MLACGGAIGGLLIAYWGGQAILPLLPAYVAASDFRPVDRLSIDLSVLAFTAAIAIGSGILFGLAPAFAAFRSNLANPLRQNARGSTGDGKSRLRYGLVAVEVALTLIVLAGAGMMLVSVSRLLGVDPGLDPRNVLVLGISPPQPELYYGPPENPQFCDGLTREVGAVPGVISVGAIGHLPLSGARAGRALSIEGRPDPGSEKMPDAVYSVACPGTFATLGIPLVDGREFTSRDSLGAPAVVVINRRLGAGDVAGRAGHRQALQDRLPEQRQPVDDGGRGRRELPPQRARHRAGADVLPAVSPGRLAGDEHRRQDVGVPGAAHEGDHQGDRRGRAVPARLRRADDGVRRRHVGDVAALHDVPAQRLRRCWPSSSPRSASPAWSAIRWCSGRPEIGVRVALGARRLDVLRLILGHSLAWAIGGVVAGVAGAIWLLRLLGTMLYGVTPYDPVVLGSVSIVLIAVVLGASYLPARRAMRVDAVTALRQS